MSDRPPNLVFILTDQQRRDTIAAWGHGHMVTPAMDSLVDGGLSFTNAHCPGATCTASRAALFTGMYAHNTGTYSFRDWGHQPNWVEDLAAAGYHCANIGKMHFQPRDVTGGFHERIIVENPTSVGNWGGQGDDDWGKFLTANGLERPNFRHRSDPDWKARYQGIPWAWDERLHSDAFVADSAVDWIAARADNHEPFFLEVGFPGPHEPWDPPQAWVDLYAERDLPGPVDFPCSLEGRPPQQRAIREFHASCDHESCIAMPEATLDDVMRMRRHYFGKISFVDHQIDKVLRALEEAGQLENSIVVFSSDHGEMLGDHGSAYKWLMYESITRVPFVVKDFRNPGKTTRTDDLVSLMDLGPTFLEWAGVPVPTRLEGRSIAPYLRGDSVEPREAVFCEDNYMVMMRKTEEKIVHYLGAPYGEYYRLAEDPDETRNLWDDPDCLERRRTLQVELLDWLASSAYHHGGHKTCDGRDREYPVRWHSETDNDIHGGNYHPKGTRYF